MAAKKDKPADEKTSAAAQQPASIPDGTGEDGGTPAPENGKPSGDGAEDGGGGESSDDDGGEKAGTTVTAPPDNSQSNGTVVPNGGGDSNSSESTIVADSANTPETSPPANSSGDNKMASDLLPDGRRVIQFLGPHQRYSRGDKAAFSVEYTESLLERGIACLPRDYAKHQKGRESDGYDLGI